MNAFILIILIIFAIIGIFFTVTLVMCRFLLKFTKRGVDKITYILYEQGRMPLDEVNYYCQDTMISKITTNKFNYPKDIYNGKDDKV